MNGGRPQEVGAAVPSRVYLNLGWTWHVARPSTTAQRQVESLDNRLASSRLTSPQGHPRWAQRHGVSSRHPRGVRNVPPTDEVEGLQCRRGLCGGRSCCDHGSHAENSGRPSPRHPWRHDARSGASAPSGRDLENEVSRPTWPTRRGLGSTGNPRLSNHWVANTTGPLPRLTRSSLLPAKPNLPRWNLATTPAQAWSATHELSRNNEPLPPPDPRPIRPVPGTSPVSSGLNAVKNRRFAEPPSRAAMVSARLPGESVESVGVANADFGRPQVATSSPPDRR